MIKLPKISESEQLVMKVIWSENPIESNRIIELLSRTTTWKPKTISTLLNRLLKKGAIGYEGPSRKYRYFPLIEETDYARAESRSFLKRVFGGSVKPMLATMAENDDLTLEDIEDLRRIIVEKRDK